MKVLCNQGINTAVAVDIQSSLESLFKAPNQEVLSVPQDTCTNSTCRRPVTRSGEEECGRAVAGPWQGVV